MNLSNDDADLFFELTWLLQYYINKKMKLVENISSVEEYKELPQEDKMQVRDAVYDNPEYISEYVSKNPDNLSQKKLEIIDSWKKPVRDKFYIERYLRKHAIFITESEKVYGVLALYQGFEEVVPKNYLPMLIEAVLLPFKGKVIYDGLVRSYNVHFGSGIKKSLKETYMKAKQNNNIIVTFEKKQCSNFSKSTVSPDWSKELEGIAYISRKLKGGKNHPAINSPSFSLLKASVELSEQAVVNKANKQVLQKYAQKVEKALNRVNTTIQRME